LARDEFPVTEHYCYLNHAGVAPMPRVAAQAMSLHNDDVLSHGDAAYGRAEARAEQVRGQAAILMGAAAQDITFVKNTTEGIGYVAAGIDWRQGDRVVVPRHEFPSNLWPWTMLEQRGVSIGFVEPTEPSGGVPIESFARVLSEGGARLVAVSWVQFARGWRTDLEALAGLCREYDALLCVDAIQGLGYLPARFSAWHVDFAMADAHKWLLGPQGIGVMYVSPRGREQLRVLEPGWNSVLDRRSDYTAVAPQPELDPTARRFEGGSLNLVGIEGLGASIDLILDAGIDSVWTHVEEWCNQAAHRIADLGGTILSDRTVDGRSGIVTFTLPDITPKDAVHELAAEGVVCTARGGGIRISPHGYSNNDDLEQLIDAVEKVAPKPQAAKSPLPAANQGPMRRPRDW
jgi:selenocysteine lyase/cysteine desulfurase